MIQLAQAMPCGNAAALILHPLEGAVEWRLLRREDADFTGEDDPEAVVVESGDDDAQVQVVDYTGLVNGTTYHYQLYVDTGTVWQEDGDPHTVTPVYQAQDDFHVPDLATFVRDRVRLGLAAELALGHVGHESGAIPVLSAPPQIDQVRLPIVTVMLENRSAEVRAIGESLVPDAFLPVEDYWSVLSGWLDRSKVQVIGWSLNPDDRLRLRDAVQRVILLNLPVFEIAGFSQIDLSESDNADFQSFNAPVYQTILDLSCLHPSVVQEQVTPIRHTEVYANAQNSNRTLTYRHPD